MGLSLRSIFAEAHRKQESLISESCERYPSSGERPLGGMNQRVTAERAEQNSIADSVQV